ncbi:uracil-DNA glycosylase family protein [Niallia sp. Sow4_A1]|uniref:Uracil-DNA glycosylase family protein n=1 Tax=Niallia hominis TaxID=3133173 RepID=A0ABV1F1J3_9BACI|nr:MULTISPECIES: uracil-DNA glycosylase family protein [Bacillaceae]MCF2650116.1 hypothetical protein [Niallia circulans]MCM3362462.1 hypothetical protein [Niallia sp. MER TA 168]CAI9395932.1 hypothetical protein BACSP_04215 [Bacillus sp. T2.9-1]
MSFENYRSELCKTPLKETYEKRDLMSERFLYAKDEKVEVYWAPFDYINKSAKVVILGITPGWTQMELAYNYVLHHMDKEDEEQVQYHAKYDASFGGAMRKNLIEMLDGIELHKHLGIDSCEQLFNVKSSLLHTSSVLRYPVFINGENYSGSQPKLMGHPIFTRMIDELLIPELNSLKDAVIIPTGKAVSDLLQYLVEEGKIENKTILFNFPHPSGANGHRKSHYATYQHLFKEQLANAAQKGHFTETTSAISPTKEQMDELIQQLKIIGAELKRGNDLKEKEAYCQRRLETLADEIQPYDHRVAQVIEQLLK